MKVQICRAPGCEMLAKRTDLCEKHYYRLKRHGIFDCASARGVPTLERFWRQVSFISARVQGCFEWTGHRMRDGYGTFSSRRDSGLLGSELAHRASWKLHNGEIPEGMYVLHACDNPACVNPEHLFLGTQQDNVDDMISKGRKVYDAAPKGEAHGMSRLKVVDVLKIRCDPRPHGQIAQDYEVSKSRVSSIKTRRTWACIP